MIGIGSIVSILAGLVVLALSVPWPDNTFLAIMLLAFGAQGCSLHGVLLDGRESNTFWTQTGMIVMTFTAPFLTVFGAPASPVFTLLSGGGMIGLTIAADWYARRTISTGQPDGTSVYVPPTPGGPVFLAYLVPVALLGTLVALFVRWLQP